MWFHLNPVHPNDFTVIEREENKVHLRFSKRKVSCKSHHSDAMDTGLAGTQQKLLVMFKAQKPLTRNGRNLLNQHAIF